MGSEAEWIVDHPKDFMPNLILYLPEGNPKFPLLPVWGRQ